MNCECLGQVCADFRDIKRQGGCRVALATALAAVSSMSLAGNLHVDIDTSGFGVTAGYLDMQLTASDNAPLATALVSNMAGFDPADFIDSSGVMAVGGGYLFRNDMYSDLFHAVNFGGALSFDLTFAGNIDPLSTYVTQFVVSAFDADYDPLGAFDPATGALAVFSWTPSLATGQDGSIAVNLSDPNVSIVPEPADTLLMGAGLAAMVLVLRRRFNHSAPQDCSNDRNLGRFLT